MAEQPAVLELERALVDLGRHVAYPPTPDLAARVGQELATRVSQDLTDRPARPRSSWQSLLAARPWSRWAPSLPAQRRLAVALVALIALAAAILAISPEARTAVADRLGLRGVLIREVPAIATPLPTPSLQPTDTTSPPPPPPPAATADASPANVNAATAAARLPAAPPGAAASPAVATAAPSAGTRLALGQPLSLDEAPGRVAFQIPVPSTLGPPDEVYVLDTPPGGQVALVYYPRPNLPQANTTGVGLLLTAFQGTVPTGLFGKGVPPGTRLEEVDVNGGHGYWIEGDPHTIFYLDSRGQGRTETTRLAGNVLLWEQGNLTLRLESALSKDAALRIATSVQ